MFTLVKVRLWSRRVEVTFEGLLLWLFDVRLVILKANSLSRDARPRSFLTPLSTSVAALCVALPLKNKWKSFFENNSHDWRHFTLALLSSWVTWWNKNFFASLKRDNLCSEVNSLETLINDDRMERDWRHVRVCFGAPSMKRNYVGVSVANFPAIMCVWLNLNRAAFSQANVGKTLGRGKK